MTASRAAGRSVRRMVTAMDVVCPIAPTDAILRPKVSAIVVVLHSGPRSSKWR